MTLRTLISVGEGPSGPTSGFSILTLVRVKTENSFFANFEGETSKGDGVIVVPSIIRREGSQETVFNKDRTSIGKTIHSTHLLRTKTFDYNSMLAIHKNSQGTFRVGAASVRLVPNHNCGCLFSTLSSTSSASLHPWFITGFADAESCFSVSFFRVNTIKIGWRTQASFKITLHQKDLALLESIRLFFQVGKIYDHGKDSIIYQVRSSKDLEVIIAHFDMFTRPGGPPSSLRFARVKIYFYTFITQTFCFAKGLYYKLAAPVSLITQKRADYELLKMAVEVIKKKTHTTVEGLNKILSLKASINNGLSPALQKAFPKVIPVQRPLVVDQEIKDPNRVSGERSTVSFSSTRSNILSARHGRLFTRSISIHTSSCISALNPLFLKFFTRQPSCRSARVDPDPFLKKGIKRFSSKLKASTNNPLSLVV